MHLHILLVMLSLLHIIVHQLHLLHSYPHWSGTYLRFSHRLAIAEAVNKEKQSLQQLMVLVGRCLEILHLWKLACDHQFEVVCRQLKAAQQASLKAGTLKSFLSSGNEDVSGVGSCHTRMLHV